MIQSISSLKINISNQILTFYIIFYEYLKINKQRVESTHNHYQLNYNVKQELQYDQLKDNIASCSNSPVGTSVKRKLLYEIVYVLVPAFINIYVYAHVYV